MMIVYYRYKDSGKIRYAHEIKEGMFSNSDLEERIAEYNLATKCEEAVVVQIDPGSFEEYLWDKAQNAHRLDMDTLNDLQNTLKEAETIVDEMKYDLERSEK